ncbi:hypothetical protein DFS34DRAFT_602851 [Phlyctochytrium arcticum]|nr:hypothetical protein DFS34DRAFT_602851 [Phlyctochytrium arcticum]
MPGTPTISRTLEEDKQQSQRLKEPRVQRITDPTLKTNWAGVHALASHSQIRRPTTELEIQQLLRQNTTCPISIVGTGLSYEQIASVPSHDKSAILLDLSHFSGLQAYDEETATFGAATSIDNVMQILADRGRMFPVSPGVIGIQTLAGSIATGTHGQGLYQGSYAEAVVSLRVILPVSGTIRIISRSVDTDSESDLPFNALVTSLGTLGIITSITITHTPRRIFYCAKSTISYPDFLDSFISLNQQSEFVKGWWFPETDQVHIWQTDAVADDSDEAIAFRKTDMTGAIAASDVPVSQDMNTTVDRYLGAMSHDTKATVSDSSDSNSDDSDSESTIPLSSRPTTYLPSPSTSPTLKPTPMFHSLPSPSPSPPPSIPDPNALHGGSTGPPQFRTVKRFANAQNLIGHLPHILTKGIPVPQINVEIAVPLHQFRPATEALHTWAAAHPGTLHYPFIYRVTGSSSAWLHPSATCNTSPVVYIGFLVYMDSEGSVVPHSMSILDSIQRVLASFGGIPHWGKHFAEWYDFRAFPRWEEFKQLQRRWDAQGQLRSGRVKEVFG